MNSSSRINIPSHLTSVARLEKLSLQDQSLFLLKHLTICFPRGTTFTRDRLFPCSPNLNQLVPGNMPINERKRAILVLRDKPWDENVRLGYVTKTPQQRYWYQLRYEISAEGWSVADSISLTIEIDDDDWDPEWVRRFLSHAERSRD